MTTTKIKFSAEDFREAENYLISYIDSMNEDRWTDLKIMIDHGYFDLVADRLVNSYGCIDSSNARSEDEEVFQTIEFMASRYAKKSHKTKLKHLNDIFKKTLICQCYQCNSVSFVADGNEELYPSLLKECWECKSYDIETYIGLGNNKARKAKEIFQKLG